MKKMAIISSYNDLCGNAAYAVVLKREFAKYYDVSVLGLDVNLLSQGNRELKKAADDHIEDLAKQVKQFDYVNIQFEAGLLGRDPYTVFKRFKKLADAAKNLVITLHRFDPPLQRNTWSVLKRIVKHKLKPTITYLIYSWHANQYADLYKNVINYCKKTNSSIIVHTQRDRSLIKNMYGFNNVYDHPIAFLDKEKLLEYKAKASKAEFNRRYNIKDDQVTIGIFGFINHYKGHHTAINAMKYLSNNYVLLIFGTQHPMSIMQDEEVNPYIGQIMRQVEKTKKIHNKVRFCGSLDDDEFINALLCCDFNVLPYLEVNQGGSGIAALTVETGSRSLFSRNCAFTELTRYAPDCFKMFSIGNHLELANMILNYTEDYSENIEKYRQKYNIHTSILLHKKLFEQKSVPNIELVAQTA